MFQVVVKKRLKQWKILKNVILKWSRSLKEGGRLGDVSTKRL